MNMMNILNKLTLRSLKLNKKRTIVTIIGIILSCAMIFGVATIAVSFQDLFLQNAKERDGNFHATFYDVLIDDIKYIVDNSNTEKAMLSRDLGYGLLEEPVTETRPYLFIKKYDEVALNHMPITLQTGRFPQKESEILISEDVYSADKDTYGIGKTLTLETGIRLSKDGMLLNQNNHYIEEAETFIRETTQTYTITGIIARPHFERHNSGYTAVTYLDASKFTGADYVNVSILAQNPRHIYEQAPEMAKNAKADRVTYNRELLTWSGIINNDQASIMLNSVALIIILLIVVGSVSVIYNAFAISVSERKKQFGMLTSVGATPKQIRRTVFFEGIILGLLGIPLGILSGIIGIGITLNVVNDLLIDSMHNNVALQLIISPLAISVTIFFVAVVILLSAYIPARRASQISPIEAIRLTTDIDSIKGKQIRTSKLTRLLFGIEGEFALKNLKRTRRRYRATVFSLFISIVLFISFSSFMTYGIQSSSMYYEDKPYNITVGYHNISLESQQELFNQINSFEGIERYTEIRSINSHAILALDQFSHSFRINLIEQIPPEWHNNEESFDIYVNIITVDEAEFKNYTEKNNLSAAEFAGTSELKCILVNKGVIRGDTMIEHKPLNIEAGETLDIANQNYEEKENKQYISDTFSLKIGAVTDNLPFGISHDDHMIGGGYDHNSYSTLRLIVSAPAYSELITMFNENIQEHADYTQLYIAADDSTELAEEISNFSAQMTITDFTAINEEAQRTNLVMAIFLYGFVALIALIGITNIFNTISTNVALRRREFAMLKSVGLTPQGFNKIINYESIFYGLKALLYGLPVSILISYLIYRAVGSMFIFSFTLPWQEIIICIAAVMFIVFITMMHASLKLKKDNIIDALKEDNL